MALHYQRAWMTLAPQHFSTSYDFYCQLLGQAPDRTLERAGRLIYAEFHLTGLTLGLYEPQEPQEPLSAAASTLSLCFQVENLEAAIEVLTDLGYPPPGPIMTPSHGREIYAFDPDGHRLILYQPLI